MRCSFSVTKVVPSQATPSTQMLALMPEVNVEAVAMSLVRTLHAATMTVAMDSMMAMIAWSRVMTGVSTRPTFSLIVTA